MNFQSNNQENSEGLKRLIRRATRANKFALIFANCSSLKDQNAYIEHLQQHCERVNITLMTVDLWNQMPINNLFSTIREHLNQKFAGRLPSELAIQVTGLEISIILDPDERFPSVLQTLNIGRERYRAELPYPLLIWLPDYAYIKLANIAPDFWSVRDGSFTFFSKDKNDQSFELEQVISGKKNITLWQDKIDQIPLIERITEWISASDANISSEIVADLMLKLGDAYFFIGREKKAQECFSKVLHLSQNELNDPERQGSALNGLGLIHTKSGNFSEAIEKFKTYIKLRKQQGKQDALAVGYNHLGFAYYKQKEYEKAIEYYQKALEITRNFGKRQAEGDVLGNLGLVYRELKQYDEAIKSHRKALQISREIGNPQGEVKDLGNLGLVCHSQQDYEKAISFYNQALQLSQRIGNKQDELDQLLNLGDVWLKQDNPLKAETYYNEALKIAEKIGNQKLGLVALEKLSELYVNRPYQKRI